MGCCGTSNADVDLDGPDPAFGFNYLGRLGAGVGELSDELWRIDQQAVQITASATAVDTRWDTPWSSTRARWTLPPTAVPACMPRGPGHPRRWTSMQVARFSRLWFEALAGICAHVRHGGAGSPHPDLAPAHLTSPRSMSWSGNTRSPMCCR